MRRSKAPVIVVDAGVFLARSETCSATDRRRLGRRGRTRDYDRARTQADPARIRARAYAPQCHRLAPRTALEDADRHPEGTARARSNRPNPCKPIIDCMPVNGGDRLEAPPTRRSRRFTPYVSRPAKPIPLAGCTDTSGRTPASRHEAPRSQRRLSRDLMIHAAHVHHELQRNTPGRSGSTQSGGGVRVRGVSKPTP
jgi:hypothetical protein